MAATPRSQNGWPVLTADSPLLHRWTVPTARGPVRVRLRNDSAGGRRTLAANPGQREVVLS